MSVIGGVTGIVSRLRLRFFQEAPRIHALVSLLEDSLAPHTLVREIAFERNFSVFKHTEIRALQSVMNHGLVKSFCVTIPFWSILPMLRLRSAQEWEDTHAHIAELQLEAEAASENGGLEESRAWSPSSHLEASGGD